MIGWGALLLLPLFLLLLFSLHFIGKRNKPADTAKTRHWKLFRDEPGDWKDAAYNPKGFRRKK
jgi:hypothetical protein